MLAVSVVLFGVCGYGVVRRWLPDGLREHEPLWYLPAGACFVAITMTPLGFAHVPFEANVAIVILAGLALAVRAPGRPARPARVAALAWPGYLALLLVAVALIPLFRSGFMTVVGQGSDAHLAAGTAEFLKHAPPEQVRPELPVDQVPLVWQSKQAIYYATAAVSFLTGLETWEVLSTLGALLLALAGVGLFVLARELLGAGVGVAAAAMAIAGLDRMVLHTGMHPYFNQTWGYLTLPWALVLAWWVLRHPSRGGWICLGLFLAVGALAYPLALPIPLWVMGFMWWRDKRSRGEPVLRWREWRAWLRARRRRVRWGIYVGAVLLLFSPPVWGIVEKGVQAWQVAFDPSNSLRLWGGDLVGYFPERQFFSVHPEAAVVPAFLVIAFFTARELARLPRAVAVGLGSLFAFAVAFAVYMRFRDFGWYFHFKILAFVGPLIVVVAAVGMSRVRRYGWVLLAVWVGWAVAEARDETSSTYDELPRTMLALRDWSEEIEDGASIRLDVQPGTQLWVAYLLADHPLCSQRPIDDTSYPHVPLSRKADYVLARAVVRPFDAVGPPVLENAEFRLYRLPPNLPGRDRCSQRMVQTVQEIQYIGK